jgi:hypothetical protein
VNVRRAIAAALLLGVAGACRHARRPAAAAGVAAARAWPATLTAGRTALTFRQFARADSVFAAFERAHLNTPAAAEASYWRALVRLDPHNTPGDTASAVAALDAYRATDPPRAHFVEAGVLRALASRVDSLRLVVGYERSAAAAAASAAANAAAARATLVPRDTLRARDEELERTRAELASARAELARVRRRIAAPARRAP